VIKRISLVRRKDGLSVEAFVEHWLGPHAEIIRTMPGLRGYRVDVITDWLGDEERWDGVGELWFDTREDLDAAFAAVADELAADRASFLAEARTAIVEEHVLIPEAGRGA
jgi:uncharacterized protein (TIGR02118 family)